MFNSFWLSRTEDNGIHMTLNDKAVATFYDADMLIHTLVRIVETESEFAVMFENGRLLTDDDSHVSNTIMATFRNIL